MLKLGVNIDHVATLRQARGVDYPSPLLAAKLAMKGGAAGITAHLREDRRHIQDSDIRGLKAAGFPLNMEMAVTEEMVRIASEVRPKYCCLVPEKRQELTTEGGLDAAGQFDKVSAAVKTLSAAGIGVSLFIDPDEAQIRAALKMGAKFIELHTGAYANAKPGTDAERELRRLHDAAEFGHSLGITVNAGHGINYENIGIFLERTPHLHELNIGHSIIARAVFTGIEQAVRELLELMKKY